MYEQSHLGYFGKIPANGDFVRHRLPPEFISQWDQWLQSGIASSKVQLGADGWLDTYLTSPVWRFALSEGVCNEQAWAGIMLPSVDRVGRYFPLTLAAPVTSNERLFSVAQNDEDWFVEVERAALSTLDQKIDVEQFTIEADSLSAPPNARTENEPRFTAAPESNYENTDHWLIDVAPPNQLIRSTFFLVQSILLRDLPHLSLWWTGGSERVQPCVFISAGLPPASGFVALLDGNWDQWGWNNRHAIAPSSMVDGQEPPNSTL
jgi:type VI secretion system protein ImpM